MLYVNKPIASPIAFQVLRVDKDADDPFVGVGKTTMMSSLSFVSVVTKMTAKDPAAFFQNDNICRERSVGVVVVVVRLIVIHFRTRARSRNEKGRTLHSIAIVVVRSSSQPILNTVKSQARVSNAIV